MRKTNTSKWYVIKSNAGIRVRRYSIIGGKTKWERYPKESYSGMTVPEVEAFVKRLNVTAQVREDEARVRYDFDHAFINVRIKALFQDSIENNASGPGWVTSVIHHLDAYVLEFFVIQRKTPDPKGWLKLEEDWGKWLVAKGLSKSSYRTIIQTANRFIKLLHRHYGDEVPLFMLVPIGKRKLDHMVAAKKLKHGERKKFISKTDFNRIIKATRPKIHPNIYLAYHFGLRAAETFGVTTDDVYKEFLHVPRQLHLINPGPQYGVLKGKTVRDIPYWQSSPKDVYELIQTRELFHPDTLSDWFTQDMKKAGMSFQFHDLRRTWITNAVRLHNPFDVQRAAGHVDFKTTQGYIQDDREMKRERFKPS